MQNLINFLIRYNTWLFFVVLEIVCLTLVFTFNPYQQSIYISSANQVSGKFYTAMSRFSGYFNLRSINEDLLEQNGMLQQKVLMLEQYIENNMKDSVNDAIFTNPQNKKYEFVPVHVISNSVTRINNYITLNKGSKDGLQPEMGVIDQNGVVGVISNVSENYSIVIPILNSKFRLSAKLKKNNYFGSLVWDGKDPLYAVLEELPRHASFAAGDTIVTSGYSDVFPDGIIIGTVDSHTKQHDDNFYAVKVLLAVDFSKLGNVLVIKDKSRLEQKALEAQTSQDK
ncbi:MAG: rod shape-determining protein MreC [Candidatus Azobacteroides sp.]|nr:rod shape-determining protein MreC [Candidatus Azobacteroides sp.]